MDLSQLSVATALASSFKVPFLCSVLGLPGAYIWILRQWRREIDKNEAGGAAARPLSAKAWQQIPGQAGGTWFTQDQHSWSSL